MKTIGEVISHCQTRQVRFLSLVLLTRKVFFIEALKVLADHKIVAEWDRGVLFSFPRRQIQHRPELVDALSREKEQVGRMKETVMKR